MKEISKVLPDLYVIRVPLRGNPLKFVNSYVIKGDRALIVDTGMNRKDCFEVISKALSLLKLEKFDFFVTHLHADHIGLVGKLAGEDSRIYFSRVEAEIVKSILKNPSNYWKKVVEFYLKNGFPEGEITRILKGHPGIRYTSWEKVEFEEVDDGDVIEIGDFELKCISTPGHSPAHMCLYDESRKILFSGDHVLYDITPNITWWSVMDDSLQEYLNSLEKIYWLDTKLVLPGHRNIFSNLRGRIDEIRRHHEKRLDEALHALKGEKTAWDVAQKISWDIEFKSWSDLPVMQKWFAVVETIAHLEYLRRTGRVERREEGGKIFYSAKV